MSSNLSTWFKHLRMRRGKSILQQAYRMQKLHRTPFKNLLENIYDSVEPLDAKFTFPTVGSTAMQDRELIRSIVDRGHEVASHGYKHLRYQFLSKDEQELDLKKSLAAFKKIGVPIKGFRAPYNMYNADTHHLIEKYKFSWDGGIGYNEKYWKKNSFFRIPVAGNDCSYICIPLNYHSDDLLIDSWHLSDTQIAKVLCTIFDHFKRCGGVVMFDLHPIRIGQKKYINGLKKAVEHGTNLNGWFPTVSEAVEYWKKHQEWKCGATFCGLLTGDIDNFVFLRDYLLRIKK